VIPPISEEKLLLRMLLRRMIFSIYKFLSAQNEKFNTAKNQIKGLSKTDSIAKLIAIQKELELKVFKIMKVRPQQKIKAVIWAIF
jgi:hypothetical protein